MQYILGLVKHAYKTLTKYGSHNYLLLEIDV